jgi:protein-S-isoprenylcysteine O-methyltransferase Ste14
MYGEYSSSLEQKVTLAALHFIILIIALWLLFLNGIDSVAGIFGFPVVSGDETRRILIIFGGLIYFIRLLFTEFVFINREVKWSEALTMTLWLFIIYMTFSFTGGSNPAKPGTPLYIGIALYLTGSFINTVSEYLRYRWKKNLVNKDRLYTGGLFRYSRHINYFGDVILFTGFAMFTGSVYPFIIPAAMLVLFIVVNIPLLEGYLREKYDGEFEDYAKRTKKFIPFVY